MSAVRGKAGALIAFAGVLLASPFALPAARAQAGDQPGWDREAREFFVKSCVHGISTGQIRDFEVAKGRAAPAEMVDTIQRELAAPCGCMQKKAAEKWQFLEFANNQPKLQGQLQAIARECMPRK